MTPQEIFNYSVRHMRKQGVKAMSYEQCQYLTDQGLSCAIGCFIKDDPELCHELDDCENGAIDDVFDEFKDQLPDWMGNNLPLLVSLQSLHDFYLDTSDFEKGVSKAANKHGLKVPA